MERSRRVRILCLHGRAANANVLRLQVAQLQAALEHKAQVAEFVYLEGAIPKPPAPGLEYLFEGENFWAWYDTPFEAGSSPTISSASLQSAHTRVRNFIAANGPFDGVLGFSQGAALAAGLMLSHANRNPGAPPLFRFAVLLCGAAAYDPDTSKRFDPANKLNGMPVAFVHGGKSDPYWESNGVLRALCDPETTIIYDHGAGHTMPQFRHLTAEVERVVLCTMRAGGVLPS